MELVSWIFTPELRDRTAAALKEHGLGVPIVYSGAKLHAAAAADKSIESVLKLADFVKTLGTRIIEVNCDPKPKREAKTGAELNTQAEHVRRLDDVLRQRHLGHLGWHGPGWRQADRRAALLVDPLVQGVPG